MTKTFEEVCEYLRHLDEITLLEVLNISSEDLVDRFKDIIEDRIEQLATEIEDEDEEDGE